MTDSTHILSKKIWGPKAWNLLHSFSFHPKTELTPDEKHDYYILYKTFYYILPCRICKIHYKDLLEIFEPLQEKKITRKYIQQWVWKIHNIVNRRLGKKQISFQDAKKLQHKIHNHDIFFFMNHVFLNFDDQQCCATDFDHIYHFLFVFAKLYPDPIIQKKIYASVQSNEYSVISTPRQLKLWYKKNYQSWI